MVRIMTDSAADFTAEELLQYNVRSIPTGIMLDGEQCVLGKNLTEDMFWQRFLAGESLKTSQPAPDAFMHEFAQAKEDGEDVICITVSSAVSGTMQSALLAADMAEHAGIHVIDSLNGMAGQKLLVLYACRLRDEGKLNAAEIAEKLNTFRHRIRLFASLDTLVYLGRSGRIPQALASIGSVAHIKPLLTVDGNGKIVMCGKAIGANRAITNLAKRVAEMKIDLTFPVIPMYSYHAGNCKTMIQKLHDFGVTIDEKIMSAIGPSVAGHVGPNAYGAAFVLAE